MWLVCNNTKRLNPATIWSNLAQVKAGMMCCCGSARRPPALNTCPVALPTAASINKEALAAMFARKQPLGATKRAKRSGTRQSPSRSQNTPTTKCGRGRKKVVALIDRKRATNAGMISRCCALTTLASVRCDCCLYAGICLSRFKVLSATAARRPRQETHTHTKPTTQAGTLLSDPRHVDGHAANSARTPDVRGRLDPAPQYYSQRG